MNIITLIIALLDKFTPVEESEIGKISIEAKEWYSKFEPKENGNLKEKAKFYAEQWYVKAGLAILFIFLNRWILDYMNPNREEENEVEY